ncbi:MAG: Fic/DOC family [Candidatus Saccharibacteria bacterium]|nr:Fic/DOC family [Candidatus Saccharibacteria bacterium]
MNELVSHKNDFSPELIQWAHSEHMLADPVTRRDYFGHMNANDFIDLTQQVASIVRTGDSTQRQHFDGEQNGQQVRLLFVDVPEQQDKEQLLRETWETAQEFLTNPNIPDNDALEYAALTAAMGILWIHPFMDGNGRTSRVVSYLMAKGPEDESDLKILMTKSMPQEWQIFAPSHFVPEEDLGVNRKADEDFLKWQGGILGEQGETLADITANMRSRDSVFYKFLAHGDSKVHEIIEPFITRDKDGKPKEIDASLALEALINDPERGIEFAANFRNLRRTELAGHIRRFLHAMSSDKPGAFRITKDFELHDNNHGNDISKARSRIMREQVKQKRTREGILPRDELAIRHKSFSTIHQRDLAQKTVAESIPGKRSFFKRLRTKNV